jgi:uncharacterized protein (DUF2164 family)
MDIYENPNIQVVNSDDKQLIQIISGCLGLHYVYKNQGFFDSILQTIKDKFSDINEVSHFLCSNSLSLMLTGNNTGWSQDLDEVLI